MHSKRLFLTSLQVRNKGTYSIVQYFLRLVEARRTRRLDLSQQDLDTVPIEVTRIIYLYIFWDALKYYEKAVFFA